MAKSKRSGSSGAFGEQVIPWPWGPREGEADTPPSGPRDPEPVRALPSAVGFERPAGGPPVVTLGWHPDIPDLRDKAAITGGGAKLREKARAAFDKAIGIEAPKNGLPRRHENLRWCPPVEDQGALGSCTAQATVGLMEFMQKRGGDHVDGSRLFLYKVTRKLLGWSGDTGAYVRTALKAVAAFGIPPEQYWPYDISRYEEEPTAFLYSFATNYKALEYARVDMPGAAPKDVLTEVKRTLSSGLGVVFGFSVYSSLSNAADIPYPTASDTLRGGHAVMAVGYDDDHVLPNGAKCPSLIIRNSWGTGWGQQGYGFLPDAYVLNGLARDFWTVLKAEWLDVKAFD